MNKPFDYNELIPIIPPGFPQIPLLNGQPVTESNASAAAKQNLQPSPPKQQQQQPQVSPKIPSNQPTASLSNSKNKQNDQNLKELKERQRLFKEAAVDAKKKGDDKVALLYLKNAKVFQYFQDS